MSGLRRRFRVEASCGLPTGLDDYHHRNLHNQRRLNIHANGLYTFPVQATTTARRLRVTYIYEANDKLDLWADPQRDVARDAASLATRLLRWTLSGDGGDYDDSPGYVRQSRGRALPLPAPVRIVVVEEPVIDS